MPPSAKVRAKERGRSPGWLSRMHRNNSPSSKRSASPATTREPSPMVQARRYPPQVDGNASSSTDTPEPDTSNEAPPTMPAFLKLTNDEIFDKFVELVRLEGGRVAEKLKNPSLDGRWARLQSNPARDRYNNIHPWANNRVHLQVPEGYNDYINASPITLTSRSEAGNAEVPTKAQYICMQGPKKETVDHVWHMLWHELAAGSKSSPAVIIMLSPTHDPHPTVPGAMFEKCFPYFPTDEDSEVLVINEQCQLGEDFKASVRFVSKEPPLPGTELEIRKFIMTVDGEDEEKPIWHFLYPSWPDFGALEQEDLSSLMLLMSLSREKNTVSENPRVIHCSAGVGRTGTFVALEFLIGELQKDAWLGWDRMAFDDDDPIFKTVNELRMQRRAMVQSAEQYAFIYEVLRRMWSEKYDAPHVGSEL